jgi:hypothetical protein
MKRALLVVFCIIALCSLFAVPLLLHPAPEPAPEPSALQHSIANAIDFFEKSREPSDPDALLLLDVVHRRFGIAEFADALQRYDQILAVRPDQAPLMRVFRRIADYDNPLQAGDLQQVSEDIDLVTIPALYCDRLEMPNNYPSMLDRATSLGNYMLTHALLACIWIQENDCEVPLSNEFIEEVYRANAALINNDQVVTDLELEAAAFLYLAGQGGLVDNAFVERVIAVQNDDGGWLLSSDTPGESHWHATVLGLLLLLQLEYPSDSYPPMLASPSP